MRSTARRPESNGKQWKRIAWGELPVCVSGCVAESCLSLAEALSLAVAVSLAVSRHTATARDRDTAGHAARDKPGTQPRTGTQPGTQPGTEPGTQPRTQTMMQPGTLPGTQPGAARTEKKKPFCARRSFFFLSWHGSAGACRNDLHKPP